MRCDRGRTKTAPFGTLLTGAPKRVTPLPMSGSPTKPNAPVAAMVESIVGCKWSLRLLALLADGPRRPSALQRACPGLSAKVMNERLRKFQRFGLTRRRTTGTKPPLEVDYSLSPLGERFVGLLAAIEGLQRSLDAGDLPSA
jgi:DNA-binding HxlR family transcriptional regulator